MQSLKAKSLDKFFSFSTELHTKSGTCLNVK
nr:MAG TPA: hypothetical protein [Caudoviricetes sp.]